MRLHSGCGRFFLAWYTLFGLTKAHSQCAIDPDSIVSDACTSYAALEKLNDAVGPSLHHLTQDTDFFAYYRLNLYNKVCPFWTDESSLCGNRACAVDTIDDEKDIPPVWRAEELSKLEGAHAEHPGKALQKKRPKKRPLNRQLGENVDESCVVESDDECDERDYCVPEDEGAASKGDYVSLVNNTEKFTGYSGPGPRHVWDAIYKENCFASQSSLMGTQPVRGSLQAANELRTVFQEYGRQRVDLGDDLYPLNDECLEQRAFYRIISGMHASISTHICWDYFNQTTGEWVRNLQCYKDRLHTHPERISNLYFNYALVSRAIAKLRKHLQSYTFCSGDPDQDHTTKQRMLALTDQIRAAPHTFDESLMFRDPDMLDLKDDFKVRFRNVSRIMDCVGCDKCRLWGKVQTAGYGAALKVLFEFDETKNGANPDLRRTELVALINTLGRLSHSLTAVSKFRMAATTGDLTYLEVDSDSTVAPEDPVSSEVASEAELSESNTTPANPIYNIVNDDDFADDESTSEEEADTTDALPPRRRPLDPDASISEVFWSEIGIVWQTYVWVIRSWIDLPSKVTSIAFWEMRRLYHFWVGLPVPEKSWEIRIPRRDEL